MTITVTGVPGLGTVTLADGTTVDIGDTLTSAELTGLEYDAPDEYNGTDTVGDFTYTVTDPVGDSDTGTTTITVNPINDPPFADDSSITVDEESEDTALGLEAPTDDDHSVSELTITVTGVPDLGTVTLADGTTVVVGNTLTSALILVLSLCKGVMARIRKM